MLIAKCRPTSAKGTETSSLLKNTNLLGTSITAPSLFIMDKLPKYGIKASKTKAPRTKQCAPSTAAGSIAKVVETIGSPEPNWKVSSLVSS